MSQCDHGWFGTNCRYKCRCESDKCNTEGGCEQDVSCVSGWFGPLCQYSDMVIEFGSNIPSWLIDNDKTTCQPDQQSNSVSISFSSNFHFTWMKLQFTKIGNFSVKFITNDTLVDCLKIKRSIVDSNEMDVSCQLSSAVNKLILSGDLVGFLCNIFVSGGRNVALKQETRQSSVYNLGEVYLKSNRAVDGNTDSAVDHLSCSHTDHRDSDDDLAFWVLNYNRAVYLYRAVVYNSNTEQQRLSGFEVKLSKDDGTIIEVYSEPGQTSLKYFVSFKQVSQPVSGLVVMSKLTDTDMALCEVETYGDYICDTDKGDLECDKVCSCERSEFCFIFTGKCAKGCPAGFYGPKCDMTCTGFCDKEGCDVVSGYCFQCASGYMGKDCNTVCPNGTYGINCSMTCPNYCLQSLCFPQNGSCAACAVNFYGSNCSEHCPDGCAEETCDAASGRCSSCKKGLYADRCNISCVKQCENGMCNQDSGICGSDCPPGTYGTKCSLNCTKNCDVCNEITCSICSKGFYGDNCSSSCPSNCDKACKMTSGLCESCVKGFYGNQCNQLCPEKCEVCDFKSGECLENDSASIIAAVAIGAFLIIFFCLVLLCLLRKKRPSGKSEEGQPQH